MTAKPTPQQKKRRLDVMPSDGLSRAVDVWRFQFDPVPSRAEAGRLLLEEILAAKGLFSVQNGVDQEGRSAR